MEVGGSTGECRVSEIVSGWVVAHPVNTHSTKNMERRGILLVLASYLHLCYLLPLSLLSRIFSSSGIWHCKTTCHRTTVRIQKGKLQYEEILITILYCFSILAPTEFC